MKHSAKPALPARIAEGLLDIRKRYLAANPHNTMVKHYCTWGRKGLGYFDFGKTLRRVSSVADAIPEAGDVLDLGTGFGYLPWMLRERGVNCVAADIDAGCPSGALTDNPAPLRLFSDVREMLGITAVAMDRVLPLTPLNVPGAASRTFDAVTCLHTVFDETWGSRELHYFLSDVSMHWLTPGGEILIMSNHHPQWTGVMSTKLQPRRPLNGSRSEKVDRPLLARLRGILRRDAGSDARPTAHPATPALRHEREVKRREGATPRTEAADFRTRSS
jgi:SAM-dependent methyltransferase